MVTTQLLPLLSIFFGYTSPLKGKERNGQSDVDRYLCDRLLEKNQNLVEDVVYDTLITKSFYFMLNMVFGYFSTPSRSC